MGPRTDRRHQQGEESRQRILDATIDIAAERGYEGTSISRVSERSGLPASSIYWHFASKDDLLAAVIERSFNQWLSSLPDHGPPAAGTDLDDWLQDLWRRNAVALVDNQDFLRLGLMLSLERRPSEPKARTLFLEVREQAFAMLLGSYKTILTQAGRSPDDPIARRLATFNMAVADGLLVDVQITGDREHSLEMVSFIGSLLPAIVERALSGAGNAGIAEPC